MGRADGGGAYAQTFRTHGLGGVPASLWGPSARLAGQDRTWSFPLSHAHLCPSVQGPLSANVPWHFLRDSPLHSVFFPIFMTLCADEETEARGAKPLTLSKGSGDVRSPPHPVPCVLSPLQVQAGIRGSGRWGTSQALGICPCLVQPLQLSLSFPAQHSRSPRRPDSAF